MPLLVSPTAKQGIRHQPIGSNRAYINSEFTQLQGLMQVS